ncbi:MAG: LPS translocon maturation chaperone LptM [Methylomicrobium sp.]
MKIYLNCLYLLAMPALAGCGQTGPLYMPGHPPPGLKVSVDEEQPTQIPERDIDQAPPPIEAVPSKPAEPKSKEAISPTENPQ